MTLSDLVVIRDYLLDNCRVHNIDNYVGYEDGTLKSLIDKITKELEGINLKIEEK